MSTRTSSSLPLACLLILVALFSACDDDAGNLGQVGDKCGQDSDCASGLVCDEFDGFCRAAGEDLRELPMDTIQDLPDDVPDMVDMTTDSDVVDTDLGGDCAPDQTRQCGTDVGECTVGEQLCVDGMWGPCSGVEGTEEVCDGLDNDCNGTVDSTNDGPIQEICGTNDGICATGVRTCNAGAWSTCKGEIPPEVETCDTQDNDCNGVTDDPYSTDARDWYADTDGDGFGDPMTTVRGCTPPPGAWVEDNQDCDDTAIAINPNAPEICDGMDNNCIDGADENLVQSCYGGPANTEGVGVCVGGTQTCNAGIWSVCVGEVLPSTELCDTLDNDCDATPDNFDEPCYSGPMGTAGQGQCREGMRTCSAGAWSACVGEVLPGTEVCDGSDNNCVMGVDEGCSCVDGTTQPCYGGPANTENVGLCRGGTQTCSGGAWGACVGQVLPALEICDTFDNDCDMTPDNIVRACYSGPMGTEGVGLCVGGTQTCNAGLWSACNGQVLPTADVCDMADNDCDPMTPDGSGEVWFNDACDGADTDLCQEGIDLCVAGVRTCSDNSPDSLDYCDGSDNDCNPMTANGSAEPWYNAGCDGVDSDLCQEGIYQCTSGSQVCTDMTGDTLDLCNNTNDDCNSSTPDGQAEAWFGAPCDGLDSDQCQEGLYECTAGVQTCSDLTAGSPDVCDNLDNDCDAGTADGSAESWYMVPCDGMDSDLCVEGAQICNAGVQQCSDMTSSTVEICNMLDDDCNGIADDIMGCCQSSIDTDFDGSNQCDDCDDTNGSVYPGAPELCDALDNDCDTLIDEDYDDDGDMYTTCTMDPALFDCDDTLGSGASINPGESEDCGPSGNGNLVDENCNGYVDEGCGACNMNDTDGDGVAECDGDCAPNDGDVYPGNTEVCDGFDNDCNMLTVENCEVGDPCNFASGTDICQDDLLCACIVNNSGNCTGNYTCTAYCNTSQTGALGDGCDTDEVCLYDILRTANIHGCGTVTGTTFGGLQGGQDCSQDSDCRSNNCDRICSGPGCNQRRCIDYCGSDDYCLGMNTTCRLSRSASNMDGQCWPAGGPFLGSGTVGQACTGDTQCDHGFCNGQESECTEACCKDSDCPSGFHCGLTGDQIDTSFGYPPPNAPSCTPSCPAGMVCITATDECAWRISETSPMCIPDVGGQQSRQAGAACTTNSQCESNFCDAVSSVCVSPCCSDAACPAGLSCEAQYVETHSDRITEARLCVAVSTDEVFMRK